MSEGTLWLVYAIGGVVGLVVVIAIVENAIRSGRKRKSFVETFDIDESRMREVHTSFGNPLGHGDIEKANAYMRDQARKARDADKKDQGT